MPGWYHCTLTQVAETGFSFLLSARSVAGSCLMETLLLGRAKRHGANRLDAHDERLVTRFDQQDDPSEGLLSEGGGGGGAGAVRAMSPAGGAQPAEIDPASIPEW